jgi:hypothetical protein
MCGGEYDEETVWVRRHWNAKKRAQYRLSGLTGLHWTDVCGDDDDGVIRRSAYLMVHGYVFCNEAVAGELTHSCTRSHPPHRITVCVVAKDNSKVLMDRLKIMATANVRTRSSRLRPTSGNGRRSGRTSSPSSSSGERTASPPDER